MQTIHHDYRPNHAMTTEVKETTIGNTGIHHRFWFKSETRLWWFMKQAITGMKLWNLRVVHGSGPAGADLKKNLTQPAGAWLVDTIHVGNIWCVTPIHRNPSILSQGQQLLSMIGLMKEFFSKWFQMTNVHSPSITPSSGTVGPLGSSPRTATSP